MATYDEYKRALDKYQQGDIDRTVFRSYYQNLRKVVNRRMDRLEDLGLESAALDRLQSYLYMSGNGNTVGAFTKQDDAELTFEKMLNFVKSEWSTPRGYKKAVEKIKKDFESTYGQRGADVVNEDEFVKFVSKGYFNDLKKILGNSPDTFREAEDALNEGVTAEELNDAIKEYLAGVSGYDEALEEARERAKERQRRKEEFRRGE